jgi:hypothetical protein
MALPAGKEPCARCFGSGEKRRIVNRNWPSGKQPHLEFTGDPCPACRGRGYKPD